MSPRLPSTGTVYSCFAAARVTTTVAVATLSVLITSLLLKSLSVTLRVLASALSPALRNNSDRLPTDDASQTLARLYVHCNLLALLTPITFGGYSSELKKALDRMVCVSLPFFRKVKGEVHHQLRYDQQPRLLAVGLLDQPDEESERVFHMLVARNALNFGCPEHVAGTLLKDQVREAMRRQLHGLLAGLEMTV